MDRKDLFEQRRKLREERLKPKLELFVKKIDVLEPKVLPKSSLGRAIAYAESMKPYFPNYFLDGRTEISDAYSERGVKPFVILRKNMLFANTEKGANVTCLYCSLTQTAIHCGLDPFRYYDWLLRNLPAEEEKQKTFDYPSYLPWSERIPERLRAGHPETEEKKD